MPSWIEDIGLNSNLRIRRARRSEEAGANSVWLLSGLEGSREASWVLKVADRSTHALRNEGAILKRLSSSSSSVPVPEVIRFIDGDPQLLLLSRLEGTMLWDLVDPRRAHFEPRAVLSHLRSYGACLARIHQLPIRWEPELRARLHGLIGERELDDSRFRALVDWLAVHEPSARSPAFVHGDFNVANVLCRDGEVSGVVDWEFSGVGWKEYELAWSLRARTHFLGSEAERAALLDGYSSVASFDASQLRYCEVLNYLHFALWDLDQDPVYAAFSLDRAEQIAKGERG